MRLRRLAIGLVALGLAGAAALYVVTEGRPFRWLRDRPIQRPLAEGCRARACLGFEAARAQALEEQRAILRARGACPFPAEAFVGACAEGGTTLFACDAPGGYICRDEFYDAQGQLLARVFHDYEGRSLTYGELPPCTQAERRDLCASLVRPDAGP